MTHEGYIDGLGMTTGILPRYSAEVHGDTEKITTTMTRMEKKRQATRPTNTQKRRHIGRVETDPDARRDSTSPAEEERAYAIMIMARTGTELTT